MFTRSHVPLQELRALSTELSMSKVTVPKKTKLSLKTTIIPKHRKRLAGKSRVTQKPSASSKYSELVKKIIAAHKKLKRPALAARPAAVAP